VVVPVLSVVLAVIAGAVVVLLIGNNPWTAYTALFKGAFGSPYYFTETVIAAIPLMLAGLAVAFSFRGGLFNIGASGQLIVGAILAALVGYKLHPPGILLIPLAVLAGAIGGAIWAGIAGVLKAWRGAHEVITTMMLNYTATLLLSFLVEPGPTGQSGPMESTVAIGNPLTPPMNASLPALIPQTLIPNNRIHLGLVFALVAGAIFWFILWRTTLGYKVRAVGFNQRAAAYAGINVKWTIAVTLIISGAFAGLAGMVNLYGLAPYQLGESFTANYGFNAIAVALLGRNNVVGVILAALLFGALQQGGAIMQANTNVSINLVNVLQGLIIFFVGADAAVRYLAARGLVRLPRWQRQSGEAAA
jgi:simple sugar transport system permease protein